MSRVRTVKIIMSDDGRLFFDGYKGEKVIFRTPLVMPATIKKANIEIPGLSKRIQAAGDDRSFVIMSALVVEDQLDKLLAELIPGSKQLLTHDNFTFALKISLLRALKMIPSHVVSCVDTARKIRNAFAHNLALESLDDIEQKLKDRQFTLYEYFYRGREETGSTREIFRKVAWVGYQGLHFYRLNVKVMRDTIESPEFSDQMHKRARETPELWEDDTNLGLIVNRTE